MTVPILSTAKLGTVLSISLQPGSTPWRDINGFVYNVSLASGNLTVGGTASIGNVAIQGGLQAAGTMVEIKGTGFASDTMVSVDGVALSSVLVPDAQTIHITLAAPAILDFRRVVVKTSTSPEISFYPVLHGVSQTALALQPIFPLQLFEVGAFSSVGSYYALLNPTPSPMTVKEEVSTLAGRANVKTTETQFTLGPGEVKEGTYNNTLLASTTFSGSSPIRMAQLAPGVNAGEILALPTTAVFSPPPQLSVQWTREHHRQVLNSWRSWVTVLLPRQSRLLPVMHG